MLLHCSWRYHCQSQGILLHLWYWKLQQMKYSWNGRHYQKSLTIPQRLAEKCTGTQTQFVIFQCQCGWLCWSLCVYEVNSRLKCQIFHFGSLNQKWRGAYFSLAKMKCLFTELFTFICSPVVSRINVSGVNELWNVSVVSVFTSIPHNLCSRILGLKVSGGEDFSTFQNQSLWFNFSAWNHVFFFLCFCTKFLILHRQDHQFLVASPCYCPFSCPADVCLCSTVAYAGFSGSGSRCWGFHPLESIEGTVTRWKMAAQRQLGVGFNPTIHPSSSYSVLPSPHSLVVLPLFTSQLRLRCANRDSHGACSLSWIPMLPVMPQPLC